MQDKNITHYLNQSEFIKDYFELIDLLTKRVKIQKEIISLQVNYKKFNNNDDDEQNLEKEESLGVKQKVSKKDDIDNEEKIDKFLEDLKITRNKIIEKENEIRRREELSKENKIMFPITKIKKKYKLDDIELKILLVLLKSEMRTAYSYRERGDSPNDILELLFEDKIDTIKARRYFYENSKLCKNNLIIREYLRLGYLGSTSFYIPENVVREILGHNKKQDRCGERILFYIRESRYANIVKPKISLNQVILKENIKEEIIRCISQVKNESKIFKDWGFSRIIKYGRGVTILFVGPPGTGKTMTAEAIAKYLNKKLYIADISQIMNLYVGETEKNIVRIFREVKEKNAVLFFDEADGMFYSRVESYQRAIDIAYNQWINIILQEIEKFDGVVILATNKSIGMDKALERRISLKIEFEIPDIEIREKIWKSHIPENAPLSSDVDFKILAKRFQFAGGHIKNVVLNAARYVASRGCDNSQITMQDLIDAGIREEKGSRFFKDNRKVGFKQ